MDRKVGTAVVLVLASVAVVVAPVQFSYVYSDSMEPTLQRYDGYAVVEESSVSVGDVILFRSERKDAYVTHRVVAVTPEGYVTRGDANPSTDQAAGAPPVAESAVVGRVVAVGGDPLAVPHVGLAVEFLRRHAVTVALAALFALAFAASRSDDRPERSVVRVRDVTRPLFAVVLVASVATGIAGTSTLDLTYVAVEDGGGGPRTTAVGEARNETVLVRRPRVPGTRVLAVGDGVAVRNRTANATAVQVTVRVPPPATTGPHGGVLRVARYPATLPPALVRRLAAVHPGLASLASSLSVLGPLYLAVTLALDGRTPIRPPRRRALRDRFEGDR